MYKGNHNSGAHGFTIIEVIITLMVTALFLTLFFQMYLAMESQRVGIARRALASDLAYSNLRKFTTRPTITCDAAKMDLTAADASTKTGLLLGDETNVATPSAYGFLAEPPAATSSLGRKVQQTVKAYAPQGCSGTAFTDNPIKLESTITYGPNRDIVVHTTYVN